MNSRFGGVEERERGTNAEHRLMNVMKRTNDYVRVSTKDEDRKEHWDVLSRSMGKVEIKSQKKLQRSDAHVCDEYIWLEIRDIVGGPGWIVGGKADVVAFEQRKGFLVVDREELKTYLEKEVIPRCELTEPTSDPKDALGRFYSRAGRRDCVTLVPKKDISDLPSTYILTSR